MRRAALALLCLLASCGESEPVPFGLDRPATSPPPSPSSSPPPNLEAETRTWPPGTTGVDVDGARWESARSVLATLAVDVDRDRDRDLLVLVAGDDLAAGALSLVLARRTSEAFEEESLGEQVAAPDGCADRRVEFVPLSSEHAIASVRWSCPNRNDAELEHAALVVGLGALPRLLERFRWRGGASDGLTFSAADRDEDGHEDVIVEAFVGEARAALVYRSTAAGLARDPDAPEAAVVALVDAARSSVRRSPEVALRGADAALGLWEALCREGERARLTVGTSAGIACGDSVAAARARAVAVAAHARLGHVAQALALERALGPVEGRLREPERRMLRDAFAAMPAETPALRTSVAALPLSGSVRRSTLAFEDEDALLVLAGEPRRVRLLDGTVEPAPAMEPALTDASGAMQLFGIERRCEGTVLLVAPRGVPFASGTVLVAPRPVPRGAPCPELTPLLRADADGFVPLGWAPQGALLARLDELWLVPLDAAGGSSGTPTTLMPDAPAPVPVPPGAARPDLSAYALATEHGVLVVARGETPSVVLVRPEGYRHEGTAIDVAISPSQRRLAWLSGEQLVWVER